MQQKKKKSSRTPRPGFSLLECYRQKTVYWSSSWARILNVFDVYYFHHHCRCWQHSEDVGLPTNFRFNVGPALQPIVGSMPVYRQRR